MKNFLNRLSLMLALSFVLFACKKDENREMIVGGNPPVLTASVTGNVPLQFATQNERAMTLNWTNPNYVFNTGISSHDVTYMLEIDTAGANFTSGNKRVISVRNDLSYSFTQKELNVILVSDLELKIGTTYNLQMRVTSTIGLQSSMALVSNIYTVRVTPYQDPTLLPPDLYITGDATPAGWTENPPASQKFTYLGSKKYEIVMSFTPGRAYKFLTTPGRWQPQYGSSSSTGGALQLNDGTTSDPPAINTPAVAGSYKITVDLGAMTYEIVKQ